MLSGAVIIIWTFVYPTASVLLTLLLTSLQGNSAGILVCLGVPVLITEGFLLGCAFSMVTSNAQRALNWSNAALMGLLIWIGCELAFGLFLSLLAHFVHVFSTPIGVMPTIAFYAARIMAAAGSGLVTSVLVKTDDVKSSAFPEQDEEITSCDGTDDPILLSYARVLGRPASLRRRICLIVLIDCALIVATVARLWVA